MRRGPGSGTGAPRTRAKPTGGHGQAGLAFPGMASRARVRGGTARAMGPLQVLGGLGGTHPAGTGCSQQLPQAPGHLLDLGQQPAQREGAPLTAKVLGGKQERGKSASRTSQSQPPCLRGVLTGGAPVPPDSCLEQTRSPRVLLLGVICPRAQAV